MVTYASGKRKAKWFMDAAHSSTPAERAKRRSVTFQGIADAMALQWGGDIRGAGDAVACDADTERDNDRQKGR
jgi:hypothetical protein